MCLFGISMHCRLALRASSLPHTPPSTTTATTAMFHYEQSHHPPEIFPRLLYLLLRPPAWTQKEAVLPGSRVKCSRDQNQPYSSSYLFYFFVRKQSQAPTYIYIFFFGPSPHCGLWNCGSPSPGVKNTHLTTEPDCVF